MQLWHMALARIQGFFSRRGRDAEFDDELRAHLALAVDEKIKRGMSAGQARRAAHIEFGGLDQLREDARAARGLPWVDRFWLDITLGARMLRKSWGLTLVGGLAMAITIGLGASLFTIWQTVTHSTLPLNEGDRIVAIQQSDASSTGTRESRLADFARWRDTLRSITDVSAMRLTGHDVVLPERGALQVAVAEMTASAFRVARVQPLLGRTFADADEHDGADPVVVIGSAIWRTGFASDPEVIGRQVQVDGEPRTVIGVMPEEFRFPVNHMMWLPLHTDRAGSDASLPDAFVFGRLAGGATIDGARAEVATVGMLPAGISRENSQPVALRVVPYAAGLSDAAEASRWMGGVVFFLVSLLLVPPCANIAILVYARTVARREEFAARHALGASRARIVTQIFLEVLVLASAAALVGYLLSRQFAFELFRLVAPGLDPSGVPFWIEFRPSFTTMLVVVLLAIVAAAIAGGWPALQVTGRWREAGLNTFGQRGSAVRLGGTWTALLALQVALSLATLPSGLQFAWGLFRPVLSESAVALDDLLAAQLVVAGDTAHVAAAQADVVRQLRSSTDVSALTVSTAAPMTEPQSLLDIEGAGRASTTVAVNHVDAEYFALFGARLLAGREFESADFLPAASAVVVNRSFIEEVLDQGDPLGRRLRHDEKDRLRGVADARRWFQIVGVVDNFPAKNEPPAMYRPLLPGEPRTVTVTVRAASGVGVVTRRLREIAGGYESTLRLGSVRSLADIQRERQSPIVLLGAVLASALLIVLLFSVVGMHTLMAFTVVQRWREIGIRSGLGAQPRRLVAEIFGRAAIPILGGAIIGSAIAVLIDAKIDPTLVGGQRIPGMVPACAALMCVIGSLALVGPARRALRIDPAVALRDS